MVTPGPPKGSGSKAPWIVLGIAALVLLAIAVAAVVIVISLRT